MNIEFPQKDSEWTADDIEKTRELKQGLQDLEEAAAKLGVKLEDDSWLSSIKEIDEETKKKILPMAMYEIIKGILIAIPAALLVGGFSGSRGAAWAVGIITTLEQLAKALRMLDGKVRLGDVRKLLDMAEQEIKGSQKTQNA